jgi:hypothetical protein
MHGHMNVKFSCHVHVLSDVHTDTARDDFTIYIVKLTITICMKHNTMSLFRQYVTCIYLLMATTRNPFINFFFMFGVVIFLKPQQISTGGGSKSWTFLTLCPLLYSITTPLVYANQPKVLLQDKVIFSRSLPRFTWPELVKD